ncbi:HNH endonuclease signature motif containing protein [Nostoc sp. ChiQUE01b]|uniref:HNH endonuclease signature motif containing protein n=1 Tax=Nostoc sp. ChiQUE01b TaxID=3075376 RepID=UPI002AD4C096|nr:HNH endonuclease signature motif containing protein [Nostoc sp. ChiQUE01b]MDZ8257401.1 HNH endonuclease signature motif containing protein [Nostoc sp. ChiQUE01b]
MCSDFSTTTFTDHVIPISKSGANSIDNLALTCFHCNRKKSDKVRVIDATNAYSVFFYIFTFSHYPQISVNRIWRRSPAASYCS